MSVQNKILDPDPDGWGEICTRGRGVFMGYHRDEASTRAAFTEDGWYRSGDIGRVDADGFFSLRGRIKEMIVTAGGVNVPPVTLEERIKKELASIVGNVVVIGDARRFLTCLITLRVDVDPETLQPTDALDAAARFWCGKRGAEGVKTVKDFREGQHWDVLRNALQVQLDHCVETLILKTPVVLTCVCLFPGGP